MSDGMQNVVAAMVFAPRPWERGLVCKGSLALRIWQDANGLQGMFHPLRGLFKTSPGSARLEIAVGASLPRSRVPLDFGAGPQLSH